MCYHADAIYLLGQLQANYLDNKKSFDRVPHFVVGNVQDGVAWKGSDQHVSIGELIEKFKNGKKVCICMETTGLNKYENDKDNSDCDNWVGKKFMQMVMLCTVCKKGSDNIQVIMISVAGGVEECI